MTPAQRNHALFLAFAALHRELTAHADIVNKHTDRIRLLVNEAMGPEGNIPKDPLPHRTDGRPPTASPT